MGQQLRAGPYQRVSRLADKRAQSIEEQNQANLAACREYGWTVADETTYADPGISASRFSAKDRPEYRRLLGDIEAGRLDIVVLWEPSRGDRKLATWAAFLDVCREHGVRVYITRDDRLYDLSHSGDWKALASDGVDSAHESNKTSDRVRRTRARQAAEGVPHGMVKYGYLRVYDQETKELIEQKEHPDQAPYVRAIIELVAGGHSIADIADGLNERGVPSARGGPWTRSQVRQIASSLTYVGKRRHNGGPELDGNWPPLVGRDVFDAAQAVLEARRRSGKLDGKARWLCSYLAVCAVCGAPLTCTWHRGTRYYGCYRARHVLIAAGSEDGIGLDTYVMEIAVGQLAKPELYPRLVGADDRKATEARQEAAELRARLDGFAQAAAAGELTPQSLAAVERKLLPQIEAAERRVTQLTVPPPLRGLIEPGADIRERWERLPLAARREVLRVLFARIAVKRREGRRPGFRADRVVIEWR